MKINDPIESVLADNLTLIPEARKPFFRVPDPYRTKAFRLPVKVRHYLACRRPAPRHPPTTPLPAGRVMIDWRTLLHKYMWHVLQEEGSAFVPSWGSLYVFTSEEVKALEALEKTDATIYRDPAGWHTPIIGDES